jgi:hypothetical protein
MKLQKNDYVQMEGLGGDEALLTTGGQLWPFITWNPGIFYVMTGEDIWINLINPQVKQ